MLKYLEAKEKADQAKEKANEGILKLIDWTYYRSKDLNFNLFIHCTERNSLIATCVNASSITILRGLIRLVVLTLLEALFTDLSLKVSIK